MILLVCISALKDFLLIGLHNVRLKGQLEADGRPPPAASNSSARNLVQIWNNQFVQPGMDDAQSSVLVVAPNFNASLIGAGPTGAPLQPDSGNIDFKAYNIDFQNRAVIWRCDSARDT